MIINKAYTETQRLYLHQIQITVSMTLYAETIDINSIVDKKQAKKYSLVCRNRTFYLSLQRQRDDNWIYNHEKRWIKCDANSMAFIKNKAINVQSLKVLE